MAATKQSPVKDKQCSTSIKRKSTDEISQLETGIDLLQEAIKKQKAENRLLQAWREYSNRNVNNQLESQAVQRAYIDGIKYELEYLHNITGIKINSSSCKITKKGRLGQVKTELVDGHCGQVEFQLKLQVTEGMREDLTTDSRISHLSISTSENLYKDMKNTIERLATESNARGFMRLVQSYELWRHAREKTFLHFNDQYPQIVSQSDVSTLHISHPEKNCVFVVEWSLKVSDLYKVVPDIHLTIEVPHTVSPPNDIVETAPDTFLLMLKQLGIEKSIHSLVCLVTE